MDARNDRFPPIADVCLSSKAIAPCTRCEQSECDYYRVKHEGGRDEQPPCPVTSYCSSSERSPRDNGNPEEPGETAEGHFKPSVAELCLPQRQRESDDDWQQQPPAEAHAWCDFHG